MCDQMAKSMGTWLTLTKGAQLVTALGGLSMAMGGGMLVPPAGEGAPSWVVGPSKPSI